MKPRYFVLVLVISVFSAPFVRGEEPSPEPESEPESEPAGDDGHHDGDEHHEDGNGGGQQEGNHEDDTKPGQDEGTKDGHTDDDHPATPPSEEKPKDDKTPEKHDETKGKDEKGKGGEEHSNGKDAEHKDTQQSKDGGKKGGKGGKKTDDDDDSEDDGTKGGKVTYGGYTDVSGMPDSPEAVAKLEMDLEKDEIVKKAKAESENGGQPENYEESLDGEWTTVQAYSLKHSIEDLTCWKTQFTHSIHKAIETQNFQKQSEPNSWSFTMKAVDSKSKTLEAINRASPVRKLSKIYVIFFKEGVIGFYSCRLPEPSYKDQDFEHKKDEKPLKTNCHAGISVKDATKEVIESKKALVDEAKKAIKDHLGLDVVEVKTEGCASNDPAQTKPASGNDGKSTKGTEDKSAKGGTEDKSAKGGAEDDSHKGDTKNPGTEKHDSPAPEKEEESEDDPPAPSTAAINKPATEEGDGDGDGDGGGGSNE